MIVECPECKTSHSKTDAELANGAAVACRRCSKKFRLGAGGKPELVDGADELSLDLDAPAPKKAPVAASKPASSDALLADLGIDLDVPTKKGGKIEVPKLELPKLDLPTAKPKAASPAPKAMAREPTPEPTSEPSLELASAPAPARPDATLVKERPMGAEPSIPGDAAKPWASKETTEMRRPTAVESVPPGLMETRPDARAPRPSRPLAQGFPREAVAAAGREVVAWAKGLPVVRKALLGGGAALVVLLGVLGLMAGLSSEHTIAYVSEAQPLWVGPLASEAYPQLKAVERGARVEVFAEAGDFALVRDALGRAGHVRRADLLDEAPAAAPGLPFADCARAPIESSIERCQSRAQGQFDSCRVTCAKEADEASCLEHCQSRFGDCMRVCEGEAEAEAAPPAKAAELPPAAPAPTPAAEEPPKKKVVKKAPKGKKKK